MLVLLPLKVYPFTLRCMRYLCLPISGFCFFLLIYLFQFIVLRVGAFYKLGLIFNHETVHFYIHVCLQKTNGFHITSISFHQVANNPVYSGTFDILDKILSKFGVDVTWVNSGCSVEEYKKQVKPNTTVFCLTPFRPDTHYGYYANSADPVQCGV